MLKDKKKEQFRSEITAWYDSHKRELPWRKTGDAYKIWLSEVILQQTRVDQGMSYYKKFIERYPSITDLAAADEDEILKLWQGLGYYSRARNLHHSAMQVVNDLGGRFPKDYKSLKKLKGVGDYTAAAVSSIAYGLPYAVVDGNVYRVLSRLFGIEEPIDSTEGKKLFSRLAGELLDESNPGTYNQALMEFGALHCTPKSPSCGNCPFQSSCVAYKEGRQEHFPLKSKKTKQRKRYFNYLVIEHREGLYINKRKGEGIWENLHDFPNVETEKLVEFPELTRQEAWGKIIPESYTLVKVSPVYKHVLSHQKISARFWELKIDKSNSFLRDNFQLIKNDRISALAVPKLIDNYLENRF